MTNLMKLENNLTMTSREIAELTAKRHPDVKRDIEGMLEQLSVDVSKTSRIYLDGMNRQQTEYLLDKELIMTLVAGYNIKIRHAIVKRWQELEANAIKPQKMLSQIEIILASAQLIAGLENKVEVLTDTQELHTAELATLQTTVGEANSNAVDAKLQAEKASANAEKAVESNIMKVQLPTMENITQIRSRMRFDYELSSSVVDAVIRKSPYSPKPAGIVRKQYGGAYKQVIFYTCYYKKDISMLFKRFVAECRQETATLASHPFIEGRFKLVK